MRAFDCAMIAIVVFYSCLYLCPEPCQGHGLHVSTIVNQRANHPRVNRQNGNGSLQYPSLDIINELVSPWSDSARITYLLNKV